MKSWAKGSVMGILCLCSMTLSAKMKVTIVADDDYAPYAYVKDHKSVGIYYDILQVAFSKMPAYDITISPEPWKRALLSIKQGSRFAIYPPYYRPKERPYMSYSKPILREKLAVFCRADISAQKARTNWPNDYFGLTFGKNLGFSSGGEKFFTAIKENKIRLVEAKGNLENLINLSSRVTDCYINDRLSILWNYAIYKEDLRLYRLEELAEEITVSEEQGYLGFTKNDQGAFPFKDVFVHTFNNVITDMQQSGELDAIVEKFLTMK